MAAFWADYIKSEDKNFVKETLNEIRNPLEIGIFGSKNYFNMGSIIRTGHNFLVSGYHAIECPAYYEKAAMTARPWEKDRIKYHETPEAFIEATKGRNIIAFERRSNLDSQDIRQFKYPEFPILLFGSEDSGIPDAILARADAIVSIPIEGLVNDFNVAIAAGIAMYDWKVKH
jgi:tRNA G18 (ribose-2'-O)-methylase SpoU